MIERRTAVLAIFLFVVSILFGLASCARTAPASAPASTVPTTTGAPTAPLLANVHSNATVLYAGHRVPVVVVTNAQWDVVLANNGNRPTLGYITLDEPQGRQIAATDSAGPPARKSGKRMCRYRFLVFNHPEFLLATGIDSPDGGVLAIERCGR